MRINIKDKQNFIEIFNQAFNKKINSINGISIDSRKIKPNDIFIPLIGHKNDGHKYIDDVLKKDGTICLDEKTNIINERIIKTESNKKALLSMASYWREKVNSKIIAVTGSNGKTTIKDLLYHIMKSNFSCSKSIGNHNSTIGLPLTFLNCKINDQYAILEMGANEDGEIKKLCESIKPNYSLITNISNAHIKNFESINHIAKCKSEIFSHLNKDGTAFINLNDKMIQQMVIKSKKITFGINNDKADFNGITKKNELLINGYRLKIPKNIYFLAESILAAYSICSTLGIENNKIQASIKSFIIPSGRGTIINQKNYTIIDDTYNASPASMKFGINRFNKMESKNHKILIIGDMLELGDYKIQEHEELAEIINSKNIDIILTIGEAMHFLYKRLNKDYAYKSHFSNIEDLKKAFNSIVKKNDIVFIKGSRKMKLEKVYN
tara:strand:+ start:4532 stop:5845 length:1314 start_codon:yes stop_codon:yes gene_type:complete